MSALGRLLGNDTLMRLCSGFSQVLRIQLLPLGPPSQCTSLMSKGHPVQTPKQKLYVTIVVRASDLRNQVLVEACN